MNVILPQRLSTERQAGLQPLYRVLYLLHGHSGDHTDWQRFTSIERYVEKYNLAVVMPAVNNSCYTDMAHGGKYFTFVAEEVPAVVHDLFPLSTERFDTFVAGLSMGGYGAFKLALNLPERYAAAASLSGALDIREAVKGTQVPDQDNEAWLNGMHNIFGDFSKLPGSQHDLFALAEKVARLEVRPRLFQCCGTEDFLYKDNLRFLDFVQPLGFDYTYEEGPGDHTWNYWDPMIQKVLAWLPLK